MRLETDGVAVRLNLLGQPGEQPDFVVAAWVLPYVYALRGDRDWRRSPQLTGSRQVSPLAVQAYKLLEAGDLTIAQLKQSLGREVSEAAVIRAITELWQQLRIIPVVPALGQPARWQLLRTRFQRAIAEGASTSQVTAISVLASIYLQAVIAASMEEVELFLAPLTARSKVREVLRGLLATRQVHTISMGHSPHFYVAGTLPEFATESSIYSNSYLPASAYFMRTRDHEEVPASPAPEAAAPVQAEPRKVSDVRSPRPGVHKPAAAAKPVAARPHFSRSSAQSRNRKPAPTGRPGQSAAAHSQNGARSTNGTRWGKSVPKSANGKSKGAHAATSPAKRAGTNGAAPSRNGKSSAPAWKKSAVPAKHNGHSNGIKTAPKTTTAKRSLARADARPVRGSGRKPAMTAGAGAGNGKRFGFTARPKQGTKKRG
ncbi:MAG TPA: hypothetical protein VFE01_06920 [Terracidiphilus sp.]|nr:hypothetical protein [Terracidiphilus sp.]